MDKAELMYRIDDLYNDVQVVRNQIDQIDSAIERLQTYVALKAKEVLPNSTQQLKAEICPFCKSNLVTVRYPSLKCVCENCNSEWTGELSAV